MKMQKKRTWERLRDSVLGIAVVVIVGSGCSSDDGDSPPGTKAVDDPCRAASPVYVGFRLDDVQAGWGFDAVKELTKEFTERGIVLTVGAIGWNLDADPDVDEYLIDLQTAGSEIASHSYVHQWHADISEAAAQKDLEQAQAVIKKATSVTPNAFIVPEYNWGLTTEQAMRALQPPMSVISGRCSWGDGTPTKTDVCVPGDKVSVNGGVSDPDPFTDALDISHLPGGAVLGCTDDYFNFFTGAASVDCAKGWINRQLDKQGFSVFVLHPQDIMNDPSRLAILSDLLDYAKVNYCSLTFDGMQKALSGS